MVHRGAEAGEAPHQEQGERFEDPVERIGGGREEAGSKLLVVGPTPLCIGEDLVGLLESFELVLSPGLQHGIGEAVRVERLGEEVVGLLDLRWVGGTPRTA